MKLLYKAYITRLGCDWTIYQILQMTRPSGVTAFREDMLPPPPAHLLADGNCIPLAIAALRRTTHSMPLLEASNESTASRCRRYRDCQTLCNVKLIPHTEPEELSAGDWLIHVDTDRLPHCVGVKVLSTGSCHIHNGGKIWTMSVSRLLDLILQSTDRKYMVLFQVVTGTVWEQSCRCSIGVSVVVMYNCSRNAQSSQVVDFSHSIPANANLLALDLQAGASSIFECYLDNYLEDVTTNQTGRLGLHHQTVRTDTG